MRRNKHMSKPLAGPRGLAILVSALGFLGAASETQAADANGKFAIRGAGLQTCASLQRAWDAGSSDLGLFAGWIDGYLTAFNQYNSDTFEMAPWQTPQTLLGLTREVCKNAGDDAQFMRVFVDLMRDFGPARMTTETNASALKRGDQTVILYEATVRAMQDRLTAEGQYAGPISGQFDQATGDALLAYQTASGIPATGLPDQRTLFSLFVRTKSE